jgi:hypothetical protein
VVASFLRRNGSLWPQIGISADFLCQRTSKVVFHVIVFTLITTKDIMFVFYRFGGLNWATASTPRCLGDQIDDQKSSKVVQIALWITFLLPC